MWCMEIGWCQLDGEQDVDKVGGLGDDGWEGESINAPSTHLTVK